MNVLNILFLKEKSTDIVYFRSLLDPSSEFNLLIINNLNELEQQLNNKKTNVIISRAAIFSLEKYKIIDFVKSKNNKSLILIIDESENLKDQVEALLKGADLYLPFSYLINNELHSVVVELVNKKNKSYEVNLNNTFIPESESRFKFISENQKLLENEKKFRAIFENSIDAIAVSRNGVFFAVNSSYRKLFKLDENDNIQGKLLVDHIAPEYRTKIQTYISLRNSGKAAPDYYEVQNIRKDGTIFEAACNVSTYYLDNELYTLSIVRDLTEAKKSELLLRESEARFRKLFEDNSNLPIQCIDDSFNISYWNKASYSAFGYSEEEIKGKPFETLINDSNIDVKSLLSGIMQNGKETKHLKVNYTKKDGSSVVVDSAFYLVNTNGKKEIFALNNYYSEKRKYEEQLRQLSRAVEQSPASIMITNKHGVLEYVNPKFLEVTGYEKEEVLGKNPRFLKSGDKSSLVYKDLWASLNDGKEWRGEFYNKKKNGEYFWELAIISPVKDEDGVITNFLAVKEDITEKKKREEQIILSETRFRSVWESSFDGMRLTDADGVILDVNKAFCEIFNFPKEQLVGKTFDRIYGQDDQDGEILLRYKINFASKNVKPSFETEMLLWDGRKIWTELSNSYIEIEGQPPLLLSIFRDISNKKKQQLELVAAKDKAEEMNKLKSNFLNNMSHEIRTPMVGILGFAQILYSEISSPELMEFVEEIIKSGNRMMNTINSILDLSRIEANKLEVKKSIISVQKEIIELTKPLKTIAEQNDLYFEYKDKTEEIIVDFDKHLLTQVVNNLVNNAIKYTRIGGIIIEFDTVEKENNDYFVIRVIDSGIGIPQDSLNVIFEEFRQVSEGLNRQFEGTGLGLTITKKIVELLNGIIEVNSEVGSGSEFSVYFPFNDKPKVKKMEKEGILLKKDPDFVNPVKENQGLPLVLLVENDSVNKTVMNLFLNRTCKLDTCESGEESVELAKKKQYEAVLMDINLGMGMTGVEAAQCIKALPGYEKTPVIAVTAYAMVGDKEKFLEAGLTHYISKPFDKESIVKLLKSAMEESKQ